MGNIGCIWAQADSDSRAYLKETLTEQSFCVAMLCAAVSPRPSKWEVMPPSSRKVYGLKTLLCVNARATAPVRQSALRSQTSPFTSVILMKSALRCIYRMKHEGDLHLFFFRACILSYVRVALELTSETTHSVCVLARSMCSATERGVGVSMQRWLACLPTTHSCCSHLHTDEIDQLELSGGLAFKSRLSGHRLNATSVDASERRAGKSDSYWWIGSFERASLQNKTRWKTIHPFNFLLKVTEKWF